MVNKNNMLDIKIKFENMPIFDGEVKVSSFDNLMNEVKKKLR